MKKVKLFSFALAALMLGACSSEDVIDNGGNGTVLPGEQGYISLGINLPTTPSSRAANDQFDDGTEDEYAVDDATLIVLEGTSESTATVTGVYTLTLPGATNVGTITDNITTSYQLTQKIKKPSANNNLYALVVLNNDSVAFDEFSGKKLSVLNTAFDKDFLNENKHILMTNAPLYTKPGGTTNPTSDNSGNVVTLTEINPENVFTTEAEAQANPAANVYVERALAKVTVRQGNNYTSGSEGKFVSAEIQGWTLDVTNKYSYLVRNMTDADWWSYNAARPTGSSSETGAADDYRFVGSVPVSAGLYRTYWGVDPNYSTDKTASDFVYLSGTAPVPDNMTKLSTSSEDHAMYCKENTFDVTNQNQNQTTRIIVAAKLTVTGADASTGTFFTLDNNKDVIYTENTIKDVIRSYIVANKQVKDVLTNKISGEVDTDKIGVNFDEESTNGDLKISVDFGELFEGADVPVELQAGNAVYDNALAEVNSHVYSRYVNGIAYYPVMIKHFGDDLTPWSADGKTSSYPDPDAAAKWLGRYGVLRNNWYDISVTSIKSIGSADVPDVYGVSDDPVESWISVKINVLSWAKRTQEVGL